MGWVSHSNGMGIPCGWDWYPMMSRNTNNNNKNKNKNNTNNKNKKKEEKLGRV